MFEELLWQFKTLLNGYVALDTETTGLFHGDVAPDVISIGLTEVCSCKVISSVQYLSRPTKKFTDNAFSVHGISWESTQAYPHLSDSWDDICGAISGKLVIAHNALYDWRVLSSAASKWELELPFVQGVFCTQRASQAWAMANNIKCSERGPSLDSLADYLGVENLRAENNDLHSASIDSELVALVAEKLRTMALARNS